MTAAAQQLTARIVENVAIACDTYRLRLEAPALARAIRPGQFVMVRPAGRFDSDPLLARPFALYEVVRDQAGEPWAIDLVYIVIGRGTAALATRTPGDWLSVWGPLGNGFSTPQTSGPVVFIAGGIGQTPFLALARWWTGRSPYAQIDLASASALATHATLLYGVRSAPLLAGIDDFLAAGVDVQVATDDGSAGHHGLVTDLLHRRLNADDQPPPVQLVACGPHPMLAAVASIASSAELPCLLSLENHMACGFGACFSCVTPIRQPNGSPDLRRVCVEGPIFDAQHVLFTPHPSPVGPGSPCRSA
jgi:dihydroorotate dehydrogenase electron transfer subunit